MVVRPRWVGCDPPVKCSRRSAESSSARSLRLPKLAHRRPLEVLHSSVVVQSRMFSLGGAKWCETPPKMKPPASEAGPILASCCWGWKTLPSEHGLSLCDIRRWRAALFSGYLGIADENYSEERGCCTGETSCSCPRRAWGASTGGSVRMRN